MPSYVFQHGDASRVSVDLSGQRVSAELEPQRPWDVRPLPTEEEIDSILDDGGTATGYPSVQAAGIDRSFTPLFALTSKSKRFDDRLVATVELLAHRGSGAEIGLYEICARMRDRIVEKTAAGGLLFAAAHLAAGTRPALGPEAIWSRKWFLSFLDDVARAKPLGFYSEQKELERLFQHDRLLQSDLPSDAAAAMRAALENDPALLAAYRRHLAIGARITGPLVGTSVDHGEAKVDAPFRFLPPSDSVEGRVFKELYGAASIPPDFDLAGELARRIRDGRLRTEPRAEDGWYAHQFHAIAALLEPSAQGLEVGPRYRAALDEAFKAIFALNRETHVKQLEALAGGSAAPPLVLRPRISVEPLPEHYARQASAYRFLRGMLEELFGSTALRSTELVGTGIDVESGLLEIEAIFRGAELVGRFELGQSDVLSIDDRRARAAFVAWQNRSDRDLSCDLRVAVPLFYDAERKRTRICVVLGVEKRKLGFHFVTPPKVTVFGAPSEPRFSSTIETILYPVKIECDVRAPPTREELRAICTRSKTPAMIRAELESRG